MKTKLQTLIIIFALSHSPLFAQKKERLFDRLQGISSNGIDFFNVDGIEITSQNINQEFSKKSIVKKFKQYSIKETDLITSDSIVKGRNFFVTKVDEMFPGIKQMTTYYFIENVEKKLTAITFTSMSKIDKNLEKEMVSAILNKTIPQSVYNPLQIDSINFAGRKIPLKNSCRWTGVNNVQCPYYGQMNWSVHKSIDDAVLSRDNQFNVIKARKGGKVVSDETIDIIFEGAETKAKKLIYDFKGVTSVLAGMSGGKTLTIYYVASPVREHYVSCVLSF